MTTPTADHPPAKPPRRVALVGWPITVETYKLGAVYHCTIANVDPGARFARAEGILPAPEANHAVRAAIAEALRCKEEGRAETILFNLCGHGHFDMQAYIDYAAGTLVDQEYPEEEVALALAGLPAVT